MGTILGDYIGQTIKRIFCPWFSKSSVQCRPAILSEPDDSHSAAGDVQGDYILGLSVGADICPVFARFC